MAQIFRSGQVGFKYQTNSHSISAQRSGVHWGTESVLQINVSYKKDADKMKIKKYNYILHGTERGTETNKENKQKLIDTKTVVHSLVIKCFIIKEALVIVISSRWQRLLPPLSYHIVATIWQLTCNLSRCTSIGTTDKIGKSSTRILGCERASWLLSKSQRAPSMYKP